MNYYYDLCNVSRWLLLLLLAKKERQWERNDKTDGS